MKFKKKIGAVLLSAALASAGLTAFAGSDDVTSSISSISGITVSTPETEYTSGKYIKAEFTVKNTTDAAMEITIYADIYGSGASTGGAVFYRTVSAGEEVPVKLSSTISVPENGAAVKIKVKGPAKDLDIYVSPNGSDAADGTYQKPLNTLSAALELASEWAASGDYDDEDVSIILRGGRYELSETTKISGCAQFSSLTVKSDGSDVIISGGLSMSGDDFQKVTDSTELAMFGEAVQGKIYKAELKDYGVNLDFSQNSKSSDPIYTQLMSDGKKQQIARYPNSDNATGSTVWSTESLTLKSDDIKAWSYTGEAWVRGWFFYDWNLDMAHVTAAQSGELTLKYLGGFSSESYVDGDSKKWYIYNLPGELDCEGEYVIYDNTLYYYPEESTVSDGSFSDALIQLTTGSYDLLSVKDAGKVIIEDIIFENANGYLLNADTDDLKIAGCEFRSCTSAAAKVQGDNNTVIACDFHDIGGTGITIGGGNVNTLTDSGSVLENCYFEATGQINRTNQAAIVMNGCGVTVKNNTVTKTPHVALSYSGNNHIVEYNEFYDCLTDGSHDAGVIYVGRNLANLGTVVRYNYLHGNSESLGTIYWDDRLSGQTAEYNVFEGCQSALFIHGGTYNTFRGNYVLGSEYGARVRGTDLMDKSTYTDADGNRVKINVWYMYMANEKGEYIDQDGDVLEDQSERVPYNPHSNTFLSNLVGDAHSANPGQGYTGVDWTGDIWQSAYDTILAQVNNKTTRSAVGNSVCDNCFVNVTTMLEAWDETTKDDIAHTGNTTALTAEQETEVNRIKNNCGIYYDGFRIAE